MYCSISAHTSSIGDRRPFAAKKRTRLPANHLTTSSGVPCRYELIWFWNVLWSLTLTLTVMPACSWQ